MKYLNSRHIAGLISITAAAAVVLAFAFDLRAKAKAPEDDVARVVRGNNAFAFDLYNKIAPEADGNVIYSPYSVSTALAIAYAGARGRTAEEMARVMRFDPPDETLHPAMGQLVDDLNSQGGRDYKLVVANRLWGQRDYKFLDSYVDLVKSSYGGGFESVDFAGNPEKARATINKWVEKQTEQKIMDLIGPDVIKPLTRMVITNAIYFKGKWLSEFKKDATRDAPFTLASGDEVQVPTMYQEHGFKIGEGPGCALLEMPYQGEELSMVVILPDRHDGLAEVEKAVNADSLNEWLGSTRSDKVRVYLPRFKSEFKLELSQTLKDMGMVAAFEDTADFSGLDGSRNLKITNVIHQAFVEVNEEGTEAAAATAVVIGLKSAAPVMNVFRADHPFLFLIRDVKTGSVLFMGRVMDPRK